MIVLESTKWRKQQKLQERNSLKFSSFRFILTSGTWSSATRYWTKNHSKNFNCLWWVYLNLNCFTSEIPGSVYGSRRPDSGRIYYLFCSNRFYLQHYNEKVKVITLVRFKNLISKIQTRLSEVLIASLINNFTY